MLNYLYYKVYNGYRVKSNLQISRFYKKRVRIGICGWGGMAINAAAIDTRIKATAAMTMYVMTRVNANGYFDSEDSEQARFEKLNSFFTEYLR